MKLKFYYWFFILLLLSIIGVEIEAIDPEFTTINDSCGLDTDCNRPQKAFQVKTDNENVLGTGGNDIVFLANTISNFGIRLGKYNNPTFSTIYNAVSSTKEDELDFELLKNKIKKTTVTDTKEKNISLADLPNEVLQLILGSGNSDELVKVALANQRLRSVFFTTPLCLTITSSQLSKIPDNSPIFDTCVDIVIQGSENLKQGAHDLKNLFKFKKLKKVTLHCLYLADLSCLLASKDSLEKITIQYCKCLPGFDFSVLSNCNKLKEVNFSCLNINDLSGLSGSRDSLEKITIQNCCNLSEDAFSILSGCNKLKEVNLCFIKINDLSWLKDSNNILEKITIRICGNLLEDAFFVLSACNRLKEVNFYSLKIRDISWLVGCKESLEKIWVSSCWELPSVNIKAILSDFTKLLTINGKSKEEYLSILN